MAQVAAAAPARPAPAARPAPIPEPPAPAETETDGLRVCARGDWCESRTVTYDDDSQPVIQPARTYQAFCQPDIGLIEDALLRMPRQFLWLSAEIGNPARHGRPIHVPFGPKIPIRCDIDALMAWTADCLTSWHERVAAALDLNPTWHHQKVSERDLARVGDELSRARRDVVAVRDAVKVLAVRVETLISLPDGAMSRWADDWLNVDELGGAAAGLELLAIDWKTSAVLGQTDARPEEILGVTCPKCNRLTLRRAELWEQPESYDLAAVCMWCRTMVGKAAYKSQVKACADRATAARTRPVLANLPVVA
jgi:hypothetical protein